MNKLSFLLAVFIGLSLTGCQSDMVKKGDRVTILFRLKKLNGTRVDESFFRCGKSEEHEFPLVLKAGEGWVVEGWDESILGMVKGETKSVILPPSKAWGSKIPPKGISGSDTLVLTITIMAIQH